MSPPTPPAAGLQRAPLDVYMKITVIRDKSDSVTFEDSQGKLQHIKDLGEEALSAVRLIAVAHFGRGMFILLKLTSLFQIPNVFQTPSLQPKVKLDIPVPTITIDPNYERDVPATYEIPRSFVRYQRPPLLEEDSVEYNVDIEDENWLANHKKIGSRINEKVESVSSELAVISEGSITGAESSDDDGASRIKRKPTLPLQMFEHMLDLLEKATGLETIITLAQAERLVMAKIPDILQIFGASSPNGPNHNEQKKQKKGVTVRVVISEVYNYWVIRDQN
jgi:hypothetical protein